MNPTHAFLALAPNTWDGLWMNRQQLMSRIGSRYPVIYSNGSFFSWQRREAFKNAPMLGKLQQQDGVYVDVPPALYLRYRKVPAIDEAVIRLHAKRWSRQLQKLAPAGQKVLYVFHPDYWIYAQYIDFDVLVYHCYDNFVDMERSSTSVQSNERALVQRADVVFASSEVNRRRIMHSYDRPEVQFLPNGVDFSLFADASEQAPEFLQLQTLRDQRVGYVGSINDKVDFALVDFLTDRFPAVDFVFVGRVVDLTESNAALWQRIQSKDNVRVYNRCDRHTVPSVLKNMSVNCIYYDLSGDNFSSAGYPLKLHEYLACGKPAVSAAIDAVKAFQDVVAVAESYEDWEQALANALANPERAPSDTQTRIDVARHNSWEDRVDAVMSRLGIPY